MSGEHHIAKEIANVAERITPFLFDGDITVRVIDISGVAWFVATDVCRALGLTNAAEAVKGLDEDEKGISSADTNRGSRQVLIISESGVYGLIFRSRKPDANQFRKWVTAEVLPTIRRTGSYVPAGTIVVQSPCSGLSLEETRIKLAKVNTAYRAFNKASAAWLWEHEGLPMPPPHLLPGWWQGALFG